MKRLLIYTFAFFAITQAYSQNDTIHLKENSWSIGAIILQEQNSFKNKEFLPSYFNGIVLKKDWNKFTYRIAIEYKKNIDNPDNVIPECCDQMSSEGTVKDVMVRVGIEKDFVMKKHFVPYVALDLIGVKSYSDMHLSGGFWGINEEIKSKAYGIGIAPTIGFEYRFTRFLSLAIESRLRLVQMKSNETHYYGFYQYSKSRFEKTFNRISALTLNYRF